MTPNTGDWPERLLLTVGVVAVIALVCWGMWRGWQNRAARQADLDALVQPTAAESEGAPLASADGRYIGTVRDGDWLDRIVAHGLGAPGRCHINVTASGLFIARDGEVDLYVPRQSVVAVTSGKGIAGEVLESGGLGIVTWKLGENRLATGFRADSAADQVAVLKAVEGFITEVSAGGPHT